MTSPKAHFLDKIRYATNSVSLVLLNLNILGFSLKGICSSGFNCHGCAWATFACPVGAISYNLTLRTLPYYAIGTVFALGFIFARLICSYLCPFGFFQDMIFRIPFFIKLKIAKPLRYCKYVILLLLVLIFPWWIGFDDVAPLIQISSELNSSSEPGMISITDIKITNLSNVPLHGLPFEISFLDAQDSPLEDYPARRYFLSDVRIAPGETVQLDDLTLPGVTTSHNGKILLTSPYNTPERAAKYNLYFCDWCPLGELTAAVPKKIARAVGVENPTNAMFQWDIYSQLTQKPPVTGTDTTETTSQECSIEYDTGNPEDEPTPEFTEDETIDPETGEVISTSTSDEEEETIDPETGEVVVTTKTTPDDTAPTTEAICSLDHMPEDATEQTTNDAVCSLDHMPGMEDESNSTADASATPTIQKYPVSDSFKVENFPSEAKSPFTLKLAVLLMFLIAMLIFSRPFCQTTCPLGAMLAIVGRFSPLSMHVKHDVCVNCGACDKVCPMDLDVRREVGSTECIFCGNCAKRCPKKCITRSFEFKN